MNAARKPDGRKADVMGNVYVSPELQEIQLCAEGVLCASGETEEYDYYEFEW